MDQHSSRQGTNHLRVAAASLGSAALFVFTFCCFPVNVLAAVPCAQVRARLGPFHGWLAVALSGLVVVVISGVAFGMPAGLGIGVFFATVVVAPVVIMTGWVLRGVRTDHAALAGFFVSLLFLALAFLLFTVQEGVTPGQLVNQVNEDNLDQMSDLLERGVIEDYLGKPAADKMRRDMQEIESSEVKPDFMGRFFFAFLGIGMLSGLCLVVAVMSRSRLLGAPERFPPIDSLRVVIPDAVVYIFIACGLMTLVRVDALRSWCYNILIILAFMYFLCGLSIFGWFITRMGMPLAFKVLITLFVVTWPPLLLLLAGVGLFDQWFDFRKLRVPGAGGPSGPPAGDGNDMDD